MDQLNFNRMTAKQEASGQDGAINKSPAKSRASRKKDGASNKDKNSISSSPAKS